MGTSRGNPGPESRKGHGSTPACERGHWVHGVATLLASPDAFVMQRRRHLVCRQLKKSKQISERQTRGAGWMLPKPLGKPVSIQRWCSRSEWQGTLCLAQSCCCCPQCCPAGGFHLPWGFHGWSGPQLVALRSLQKAQGHLGTPVGTPKQWQ